MDIQQLCQSLKMKWLTYYEENRDWLVEMRIWGTYDGLRRPSSGYILATLSVLEPQFKQMLDFILDLNSNPDEIVRALGLNFDPERELSLGKVAKNQVEREYSTKMLPIVVKVYSESVTEKALSKVLFKIPVQPKSVPSAPQNKLAITTEIPHTTTTLPSLVPSPTALTGRILIKKPLTYARSLATWVDELCQGAVW